MAQVTLPLVDIGPRGLPPCCVHCGGPVAVYQGKPFLVSWWGLGRLRWCYVGVIGAAFLTVHYLPVGWWKWLAFAAFATFVVAGARRTVRLHRKRWLTIYTPLCRDHQDYWDRYVWWQNQGLPILAAVASMSVWGLAMSLYHFQPVSWARAAVAWGDDPVLLCFLSAACSVGMQGWKEAIAVHPTAITNQTVTLTGVCDEFAAIVLAERQGLDDRA